MSFLVFEKNPFIRCDILETLSANFPGAQVSGISALEELAERVASIAHPFVAVLSSNTKELDALYNILRPRGRDISLVVISDDPQVNDDSMRSCHRVARPFNTEMLLRAVRNALSVQQSVP